MARRIVHDRNGYFPGMAPSEMADAVGGGHLSFRLRKDQDADTRRNPVRSQPKSVLSERTADELS